jgi:protein O-mannosyl-transferase
MPNSAKRKVALKRRAAMQSVSRVKSKPLAAGIVCTLLAAIVFLVFGQTLGHEFINYDDQEYVYENPKITGGLSLDGIQWAFTHVHAGNWHPLTTISHQLDCQLYGVQPWGHHLTNVLLHVLAAVFLFLALRELTGALWSSAVVAAVFAIHPLRVESVAWIAERKDVLSGVFFMLTLWAYARYARSIRFSFGRYATVVVLFALGLMCKPSLVTLPFVLLLLDYWPLRRVATWSLTSKVRRSAHDRSGSRRGEISSSGELPARKPIGYLLVEKWPLFVLSAVSCVATLAAQKQAVATVSQLAFEERVGNAIVSYVVYLGQMIWPVGLAVVYPYTARGLNIAPVLLALLLLLMISVVFIVWRRQFPFLVIGWLWFLGVLIPMIGIVQVGIQMRADRYTYLAQIGLYLLLTWGAVELLNKRRHGRDVLIAVAVLIITGLTAESYVQASYWQNSEKLWNRVLANTHDNSIAQNNLGLALKEKGHVDDAIGHFRKAIENCTNCSGVYNNLANAFVAKGDWMEAITWYRATIRSASQPDARNNNNLGIALARTGKPDEALAQFREAVGIDEDFPDAHYNLAMLLLALDQPGEAVIHLKEVLRLKPDDERVKEQLNRLGVQK